MMYKRTKYLIVCTVLLSSLSLNVYRIHATEGTGTTIVSANYTDEDLFKLEVHVGEGGKVLQGSSVIEKGTVVYELPLDTRYSFTLVPHKGYKVKSIVYERRVLNDSQDITDKMKESVVSIDIESTDMELYITFEKTDEEPEVPVEPEEPEVPKKPEVEKPKEEIKRPSTTITTGDQTRMRGYIALFGLTGIILILVVKRKKDEEENEKGL